MTDPKRWSEGDSEIDPVLRSVLRYAKDFAPTASETQALLRRVSAAATERRSDLTLRVTPRRRMSQGRAVAFALALGAGAGSVAWAGYATYLARSDIAEAARAPRSDEAFKSPSPKGRAEPALPASAVSAAEPAPAAPGSAPSPRAGDSSRASNAAAAVQRGEGSLQSEAELLQSARARLSSDPSGALRLTVEHVERFPSTALAEERSALAIEAKLRLGAGAEAESALQRFETDYPRSPYRRRLRALLSK
ncbi:MAG TPA: hypothetical protein VG937_29395 [Polyangiaceae bacterium]|nr:hypothetical protein [Polyangiaceae bacterium]